jgi:hypothetical protein
MRGACCSAWLFVPLLAGTAIAAPPPVMTTPQPVNAAPAPSPVTSAPPPVMRNPNAPQRDEQQPQEPQFTALSFVVKTGGDDLRSDSEAWINLTYQDQSSQNCLLKNQGRDGWGNDSTHDEDIPVCVLLSPKTLAQLKAAQIMLGYRSANYDLETPDNWNVDRVRIEALNSANHSEQCLLDEAGDPLVRLKANGTSVVQFYQSGTFDLGNHPSTC